MGQGLAAQTGQVISVVNLAPTAALRMVQRLCSPDIWRMVDSLAIYQASIARQHLSALHAREPDISKTEEPKERRGAGSSRGLTFGRGGLSSPAQQGYQRN